jgi:hypothetical protein
MNASADDWHFTHLCQHFSKDNAVGWIDPEGTIHTTALHGHLEFFIDGCAADVPGLEDCLLYPARESHDRQTEEWAELYNRGARRWHEFDEIPFTPDYEQERDAYDAIYTAGWGRIGRFKGVIEIECYRGFETELQKAAEDLAVVVECRIDVTALATESPAP